MSADGMGTSADRSAGKQPTIYDVARQAGVSHQTVSRLLKGDPGIKPMNRERVLKALDELGYRPNLTARSLATNRSHRVAALTQEITQVGPGRVAQGASEEARAHGYVLDIITLDVGDRANVEEAIKLVNQHDVAGILALASTDELRDAFESARFQVPVVIPFGMVAGNSDGPDMRGQAMRELVDHLVTLGHRRFLHLAGPGTWVAARNRREDFDDALAAHGLALEAVVHGDWSAKSGYDAVHQLGAGIPYTAILAANDQMAIGAILALSELGLRVPEDVSVTGMDDIPEAAYVRPPLTTIQLGLEEEGRDTFRQLLVLMTGEQTERRPTPATVVLRRSTGPARS
ncbi:LacI family DNA-binding transcriptional regulator [Humibacter ginsengisoli]